MPIAIPDYIKRSGVAGSATKFEWDDPWKCRFEVARLDNQISSFYGRTVMAIATATAEWIVWSLPSRDDVVLQFIEACWVSIVDRRYLNHVSQAFEDRVRKHFTISKHPRKTDDLWTYEDLRDPVRGPQLVAIHNLGEVADRTTPKDNGSVETVYLSNLAEQVLTKSAAAKFKEWRRTVIKRLQPFYLMKMEEDDWLGPPVPPQVVDPAVPYTSDLAPELIRRLLKEIDPSTNPFLVQPAELNELGFEAKPYTY